MQTFALGPKQLQHTTSAKRPTPAAFARHLQTTGRLSTLASCFSSIPVYAPARRQPAYSKQDANVETAPQPEIAPAPAPPEAAPAVSSLDPQSNLSGTIPDIITPPGEGKDTAPESEAPAKADVSLPSGGMPVVANIHLNSNPSTVSQSGGNKTDPVISGVTQGALTQPGGKVVDPFGAESYEPSF